MLEVLQYKFIQSALIASILGGATCGIAGVWIIMMRIPFVGVAIAHSAFAGAILGLLVHTNPLFMAVLFATVSAFVIGPIADRAEIDPNISIGVIFSIVLGVAFLGMGLIKGSKTEALNLIWGNILLISKSDILWLVLSTLLVLGFLLLLYKEIQAVLFHRELARAVGIPERLIFYLILFLAGLVVTLNLNTIGGLLIFSLIINPPSAAYQLTYRLKWMFLLSAVFGITSCLGGLVVSFIFDVPVGAVIIIISSIIFGLSFIFSPKRRIKRYEQP